MQTITKFTSGRWYFGSNNHCFYELLERDGHNLVFRVWRAGTDQGDGWKEHGVSNFGANELGAFEKIILNGTTVMSDSWSGPGKKVSELPSEEQNLIMGVVTKDVEYRKAQNIRGSKLTKVVVGTDN